MGFLLTLLITRIPTGRNDTYYVTQHPETVETDTKDSRTLQNYMLFSKMILLKINSPSVNIGQCVYLIMF